MLSTLGYPISDSGDAVNTIDSRSAYTLLREVYAYVGADLLSLDSRTHGRLA